MKPTDFRALTPKLTVKVGDVVKAGDALFTVLSASFFPVAGLLPPTG